MTMPTPMRVEEIRRKQSSDWAEHWEWDECNEAVGELLAAYDALTDLSPGDLNRYPCGCWLRACSAAHERSPSERDRLRAALEQIEREWGTSMDNTPLIARVALAEPRP